MDCNLCSRERSECIDRDLSRITADEANLHTGPDDTAEKGSAELSEQTTGGLVVWMKEPSDVGIGGKRRGNHSTGGSTTSKNGQDTLASSWDFNKFNSAHPPTKAWMEDFVEGSPRVSVPYRCNRMVLFKSSLLHKTSRCTFKPGYLNRRVRIFTSFGI
eukprot:COSAG02_NODE_3753_length_6282_cov_25.845221_7_plen_159_part_00